MQRFCPRGAIPFHQLSWWLGLSAVNGARSSAIIYSLVETAKANNLNVFQYLYTLLLYMPDYKQEPAGVEAMMPWNDFIKERCSKVMDTETETPENRGQIPL